MERPAIPAGAAAAPESPLVLGIWGNSPERSTPFPVSVPTGIEGVRRRGGHGVPALRPVASPIVLQGRRAFVDKAARRAPSCEGPRATVVRTGSRIQ